jgi:methionine synthase I (cobalamin-dependent)
MLAASRQFNKNAVLRLKMRTKDSDYFLFLHKKYLAAGADTVENMDHCCTNIYAKINRLLKEHVRI